MKAFLNGLAVLGLLFAARGAFAQIDETAGDPISRLPERVKYAKGKLSLFADFENRKGESVTIFVVNDTDQEIRLSAQDGDLYIKQEAKVAGTWERSQAHRYSWCGNSYFPYPAIPPGHFLTRASDPSTSASGIRSLKPAPGSDPPKTLPVRFRFYTEPHFEVVSNEGEMPVSLKSIELARFDTMALTFGPVDKVAAVAAGEVEVEALDHMPPRQTAIGQLSRFPGNSVAQKAVRKALVEQLETGPGADHRQSFAIGKTLRVVLKILPPDEASKICREIVADESSVFREVALGCLSRGLEERKDQTNALLDSFLKTYDDPLYLAALRLRSVTWPEGEERRKRLKAIFEDPVCPDEIRAQTRRLYYGLFPNRVIRRRSNYSNDTGLFDVSLENISEDPITLEYSHPYDLIRSQVEIGEENKVLPYRDDLSEVIDSERHGPLERTLQPGETITLKNVNLWRYHRLPTGMPDFFGIRFVTDLPQFGDVPAGVGSTVILSMINLERRAIVEKAMEESRR